MRDKQSYSVKRMTENTGWGAKSPQPILKLLMGGLLDF